MVLEVYNGRFRHLTIGTDPVTPTGNRPESQILRNAASAHAALSPENLTWDGEASASHVRTERARLNRALKALSLELGRTISEQETWAC